MSIEQDLRLLPRVGDFSDQLRAWFQSLMAFFPSCRTNFIAIGLPDLPERPNLSEHLRNVPADRRSQHFCSLNYAVWIDYESSADIDILVRVEHLIDSTNLATRIGKHRKWNAIRHQFREFVLFPALMNEVTVN